MARSQRPIPKLPPAVPGPVEYTPVHIFAAEDLEPLWRAATDRVFPAQDKDTVDNVLGFLNASINDYVAEVRRERFATAGDSAEWSYNVSASARELLAALGVRPLLEPRSFDSRPPYREEMPAEIIFALTSEDTVPAWRSLLHLPEDFSGAVRHAIGAVWWLARASEMAAQGHEVEKKRHPANRRRKLLSRKKFVLGLGSAFELLLGEKVPKTPHAADDPHPFNRFCLAAFRMAAERIEGTADNISAQSATYPLQAEEVDAVKALAKVKASSIRDDVRDYVFARLNRTRP